MPVHARRTAPLRELDDQLGPVLNHTVGTPTQRALAILTRAHTLRLPPALVHTWVRSRAPEDIASLTQRPQTWGRLSHAAQVRARLSSSSGGRAVVQNRVAVRLVARVLLPVVTPAGWSDRRVVSARAALGVVGVELLRLASEKSWDTALVSRPWLATRLGVAPLAAGKALQACVDLGWLKVTQERPGSAKVVKLGRLPKVVGDAAWGLYELVEAMIEGPVDEVEQDDVEVELDGLPDPDRAAAILRSAGHPVWGWTELGNRGWLVALADAAADVDPTTLGLSQRSVNQVRRDLRAAGLDRGDLADALDQHAQRTGAWDRYRTAEADRVAKAAARTRALQEERTIRALVRPVVDRILTPGRVPGPSEPTTVRTPWLAAVRAQVRLVLESGPGTEPTWAGSVDPVRDELVRRAKRSGYDLAEARKVAGAVLREVDQAA